MQLKFRNGCAFVLMMAMTHGCGDSGGKKLDRHVVSGTVTFDGAPLSNGAIQFYPATPVHQAIASGTIVKDGAYKLPENGGLIPGTYKVSISAAAPVSLPSDPNEAMAAASTMKPPVDMIPSKYNSQTELTCEVSKEGDTIANFELKSGKK